MCWNGDCFTLASLSGKKVAVIVSGAGHLEYSWAYETALRLNNEGVKVQLLDLSKCASTYAMRLKLKGFLLPSGSRSTLRFILLKGRTRVVWTSFIGVELALRKLSVGVLGDAVYAECFGENWTNSISKLEAWLANPKKIERESLLPYANYLAVGGYPIPSSRTSIGRIEEIEGLSVDFARFRIISR